MVNIRYFYLTLYLRWRFDATSSFTSRNVAKSKITLKPKQQQSHVKIIYIFSQKRHVFVYKNRPYAYIQICNSLSTTLEVMLQYNTTHFSGCAFSIGLLKNITAVFLFSYPPSIHFWVLQDLKNTVCLLNHMVFIEYGGNFKCQFYKKMLNHN